MPDIRLYPRDAGRGAHDVQARSAYNTRDIFLRARPRGAGWGAHDIQGYAAKRPEYGDSAPVPPPDFPAQFFGLRTFYGGAVRDLCLVAAADAGPSPNGLRVSKNGVTYAAYLVETSDPNASSIRLRTSTGTKAIRLKT